MKRRIRLRALCAAVAVLAFLVYLNLSQVDDESEAALRSSAVLSTNVERVVHEQHSQVVADAVYEYLALVVTGSALTIAVAGDRLRRLGRVAA